MNGLTILRCKMGVRHFRSVGDFNTVGAKERGRGKLGFLRSRCLVHLARHLDDAGWPESFWRPRLVLVFKLVPGSIDVATESAHVVESALPETSPRLSTSAGPDGASLIPFTIISYSPAQVCRFAAFWLSFFGFMAEPKERPLKQESPLVV
jgi:hypothetical protein